MTKAKFETLPESGNGDALRTIVVRGGVRRYLTAKYRHDALLALKAAQKKQKALPQEAASVELLKVIGVTNASWDSLRKPVERSWRPGSKSHQKANRLASLLLRKPVKEITAGTRPDEGPDRPRDMTVDQMQISYPERIADNRAVIVGQLPSPKLHPVVLVKPREGDDYWYPQSAGKHNPIQAGVAFSCLVHFGSPTPIHHDHPRPVAAEFDVRVCALKKTWPAYSARLTTAELERKMEVLGTEYLADFRIQTS